MRLLLHSCTSNMRWCDVVSHGQKYGLTLWWSFWVDCMLSDQRYKLSKPCCRRVCNILDCGGNDLIQVVVPVQCRWVFGDEIRPSGSNTHGVFWIVSGCLLYRKPDWCSMGSGCLTSLGWRVVRLFCGAYIFRNLGGTDSIDPTLAYAGILFDITN